jgi:type I restriction enzyme S subunit
VLKWAFEGKLTEKWRNTHQDSLEDGDTLLEQIKAERKRHYQQQLEDWKQALKEWENNGKETKKPTKPQQPKDLPPLTKEELGNLPSLPNGWMWTNFCNVTYKIGDIDHKMPRDYPNGYPYLSTGNLQQDGIIDFENAKTISPEDFDRLSLKIQPQRGDIIFPRYGTIGRNFLVNFDKKFLVSYSCAIIKNITKIMNEKFVFYYSLSPYIKKEIKRYVKETTQANIGIASIESFVFPLCSELEQTQIVQEIESRLSVCDQLEATLTENLDKAEALRQSILKRAFEGKLVL